MQAKLCWVPVSQVKNLGLSIAQHFSTALRSSPTAYQSSMAYSVRVEVCGLFVLEGGTEPNRYCGINLSVSQRSSGGTTEVYFHKY